MSALIQKMRTYLNIASGRLRGLKLESPKGDKTRPTGAKVRQAVMDSLAGHLDGATFLDLFAGSGAIGIDAVSNGAEHCIFVEKDRDALHCLRTNVQLATARLKANGEDLMPFYIVTRGIELSWKKLAVLPKPDIIWADPPYPTIDFWQEQFAERLPAICKPDTLLVWEMPGKRAKEITLASCPQFEKIRERSFGDTTIVTWTFKGE